MQTWVLDLLVKLYQSEPVQKQLDKWKLQFKEWLLTELREFLTSIQDELKSWLPKILKTVLVGIAQSAGQLAINTTDRVTDIIPGPIDDAIVDPFVEQAVDRLGNLFGIDLTP